MERFLALQHTYDSVEVAFFEKKQCKRKKVLAKQNASTLLIPTIDALLKAEHCKGKALSFIAVNQGPGPFTTLRVTIATANGIAFASNTPLVGIDGIATLLHECQSTKKWLNVALLNAFAGDIYFAFQTEREKSISQGYAPLKQLIEQVEKACRLQGIPPRFIGNGARIYQETLLKQFPHALIPSPLITHCSIEQIGKKAYERFSSHTYTPVFHLSPLYLKHTSPLRGTAKIASGM